MSFAVVMAVAQRKGTPVKELRPLHDVVDPDALDALCTAAEVSVTFSYDGYMVTINGDESIHLEEHS
ncbi:HalOD1 output domain-containing protein [Natrarchaeobius halalkaliphilus]|uniref:HalOD1 output domain-containing protein n=1 Tax=Natrarchaeobius halalkaliphilus TaxID=1679091 RepID=UPI001FB296CA|nr:HalOD1 output domain-containing protein [Natrarchaeobius halalkaliphilus]